MDPRERLKRYLEQRKELGERELVLDGMTVDEVMSIVGAMGATGARTGEKSARKVRSRGAEEPAITESAEPDSDPLAAAAPHDVRTDSVPSTVATRADSPPPAPGTDWREALRASGAAPETRPLARENKAGPVPLTTPPPTAPPAPPASAPAAAASARPSAPQPPVPSPSKRYEFPRAIDTAPAMPTAAQPDAPSSDPASSAYVAPSTGASPVAAQVRGAAPGSDAPLGLVVGSAGRELFGTPIGKLDSLEEIAKVVAGCRRCPLYASATNPVPGEGNPSAELVVVGEAPGANEDATGRPFVGQSGELLTKILGAISLRREDVFICNVLKHRPPGNRNPMPEEVVACSPYLVRQLELIRPKVIVAFGTFAAQTLLETKLPIGKLRGSIHRYHGVPLIVTYHPAALLRNPAWKRPTWEDVQLARRILDTAQRA